MGEGHEGTFQARIGEEAFGLEGERVGEDGGVEVDERSGHADWGLVLGERDLLAEHFGIGLGKTLVPGEWPFP